MSKRLFKKFIFKRIINLSMRKITKVIVLWQIYKILGLEVNNYFLNLFIKDIIKSGMVRKKICYA